MSHDVTRVVPAQDVRKAIDQPAAHAELLSAFNEQAIPTMVFTGGVVAAVVVLYLEPLKVQQQALSAQLQTQSTELKAQLHAQSRQLQSQLQLQSTQQLQSPLIVTLDDLPNLSAGAGDEEVRKLAVEVKMLSGEVAILKETSLAVLKKALK